LSPDAILFPEKLQALFRPHRYKVVYGGRGKGGSWGFARALLLQAWESPLRVLCTREVQRTIADSVHRLLSDQISLLGLSGFYDVKENEITGPNGSIFSFAGLRQLDAGKIKSYEGYERAWVEEAENISKSSWDILIPTIRKPGSEIWVNFNPQLDTDETYQRFVVRTPPDTALISMSYRDNPWFPEVLEKERQYLQSADPKAYQNIWEGKCRTSVDGAIYAEEIREAIEGKRIRPVPYDPMLKVHTVWDLGFNDRMSIIFVQRLLNQLMVIDFLEDSHKKYDWYVSEIRNKRYNLGKAFVPHDAAHDSPLPIDVPAVVLRKLGLDVAPVLPREGLEIGIKRTRMAFNRIFFDEVKAAPLVEHLRRYRRAIPTSTNEARSPLHDEHSHAADALRYMILAAPNMVNEEDKPLPLPRTGIV
jgi:phage terminase large subunit